MIKVILTLLTLFPCPSFGQGISDLLSRDKKLKKDKEFILEIEYAINKIKDSLTTDLNQSEELFIIRGVDIQDRTGYGTIWDKGNRFKYSDQKVRKGDRIVGPNPIVSQVDRNVIGDTDEFRDLYNFIEKWDKTSVTNYVEGSPKTLSGILQWIIIRVNRKKVDYFTIRDFVIVK